MSPTKKRATLTVRNDRFVRLTASNGESLLHGEILDDAERGRVAVINAMVQVLQGEGYTVTPPETKGKGK